ncbi:MAG: twin-arginine translocase TatA/TatE family subunit [Ktedonobacteraceae bacterium]|nr:twin-arginine translocase TatA/TatE family subunit [Ktedonobacteraceae bacterium]
MFGHGWEIVVILAIALLIFGPKKLPEMGSAIGKSIKEFKKGMDGLTGNNKEPEEAKPTTYNAIPKNTSASEVTGEELKASDFQAKNSEAKVE